MKSCASSFTLSATMLLTFLLIMVAVESSYAHQNTVQLNESEVDQEITRQIERLHSRGVDESVAYKALDVLFAQRAKLPGGQAKSWVGLNQVAWEGELTAEALTSIEGPQGALHSIYRYTLKTAKGSYRLFSPHLDWSTLHNAVRVRVTGLLAEGNILVQDIAALETRAKPFHNKGSAPSRLSKDQSAESSVNVSGSAALNVASSEVGAPQEMRALVIAVNYTDNTTQALTQSAINEIFFGASNSMQDYWDEASYGRMALTGTTKGWYTLDITSSQASAYCNGSTLPLVQLASTKAEQDGADLSLYDTIVVVLPQPAPACPFAGIAGGGLIETANGTVGYDTNVNIASYLALWPVHLPAQELTHLLGIAHAKAADFVTNVVGDIGAAVIDWGSYTEYGDQYSTMGGYLTHKPGHLQAVAKVESSWLQDEDIATFSVAPLSEVIEPMSSPLTGKKGIKIFRGAKYVTPLYFRPRVAKEYLWLETRAALGYDSTLDPRAHGKVLVHLERYTDLGDPLHYLLDMHPETGPDNKNVSDFDFYDAGLNIGETFHDPYAKVTIQYVSNDVTTGNAVVTVTADPDRVLDADEDGLSDSTEATFGTDPMSADTDGDGVEDLIEFCYDGDCSTYNPYPTGGDLNASVADTDGDLVSDGEEYLSYTNPLSNLDTDSDGMSDDWEQLRGTNKLVDDAAADTDGDGVVNIVESDRGTLPNSAASKPELRILYVNSAASGFEDGSQASPYKTGTTAVANALSGDTVQLMSGSHNGFTVNKPLRVLGQMDGSASVFARMTLKDVRWGEIEDMQLDSGMLVQNSKDVFLSNSNVTSWDSTYWYEPQLQSTVFSSTFLVKEGSRLTIRNSVLAGAGDSWGMRVLDSNVILVNNTIVGFSTAVERTTELSQVTVHNTILYNNATDLTGNIDGATVSYSLLGTGQYSGNGGNVTGDPRFMDAGAYNFQLAQDSPVLDAGDPNDDDGAEPVPSCGIEMGAYGNTAYATPTPDSNNNGVGDACEADMAVAVTATPQTVTMVGEEIRYLVTVTNHGPRQAENVTVSMNYPAGVRYLGVVSQGECPNFSSSCTLGVLPANASASIELFVIVGSGGNGTPIVLTASVTSAVVDPVQSNDTASASVDTTGVAPTCLTGGWPYNGVTGYVKTATGTGINSVSLVLQGPNGCRNSLKTSTVGYYSGVSLTKGASYTLTPSKSGCSFTPVVASFTKDSSATTKNFTGTCAP